MRTIEDLRACSVRTFVNLRGLSRNYPHFPESPPTLQYSNTPFPILVPSPAWLCVSAVNPSTLIPQNPQPTQKREINHLRRFKWVKAGKAGSLFRFLPAFSHFWNGLARFRPPSTRGS